jgi:hypothetical protein
MLRDTTRDCQSLRSDISPPCVHARVHTPPGLRRRAAEAGDALLHRFSAGGDEGQVGVETSPAFRFCFCVYCARRRTPRAMDGKPCPEQAGEWSSAEIRKGPQDIPPLEVRRPVCCPGADGRRWTPLQHPSPRIQAPLVNCSTVRSSTRTDAQGQLSTRRLEAWFFAHRLSHPINPLTVLPNPHLPIFIPIKRTTPVLPIPNLRPLAGQ